MCLIARLVKKSVRNSPDHRMHTEWWIVRHNRFYYAKKTQNLQRLGTRPCAQGVGDSVDWIRISQLLFQVPTVVGCNLLLYRLDVKGETLRLSIGMGQSPRSCIVSKAYIICNRMSVVMCVRYFCLSRFQSIFFFLANNISVVFAP